MRIGGPVARSVLAGVALATSAVAACCFLTVWSYWYHELDADCADGRDCKCVLFGTSLAGATFVGGERSTCRYAFRSALASVALAACACVYYGCVAVLCRGRRLRRPVADADVDAAERGGDRHRNPRRHRNRRRQPQRARSGHARRPDTR